MTKNLICSTLLLVFVACAGLERNTYNTIDATRALVDTSLGTLQEYRKVKEVPKEDLMKIAQAANIYIGALAVAESAILSVKAGDGTQDNYHLAIKALRAAADDITKLIEEITNRK